MRQQFTSTSVHRVDGKGRVSIPASFRSVLEEEGAGGRFTLIPAARLPQCIEGYSPEGFAELAARIAAMNPGGRDRLKAEHKLLHRSHAMSVDDAGRIVLPPDLRERFGIRDQALFVGSGETFQIWRPEAYEAEMAALFAEEDEDVSPVSLLPWQGPSA